MTAKNGDTSEEKTEADEADGPDDRGGESAASDEVRSSESPREEYKELLDTYGLKSILECVLFLESEPLITRDLAKRLDVPEKDIAAALDEMRAAYDHDMRGLELIEIAEGWQVIARRSFTDKIFMLDAHRKARPKFNRPCLETLAIIAYKQPISRQEVDDIRGVNSTGAIKTLMSHKMIDITGRRKALGNPLLYGTTMEFLKYFGLKDLKHLPELKELKELEF